MLGDSVHPCATLGKIPTRTALGYFPVSMTALLAHSVIFLLIFNLFPLIYISHIFFYNPVGHAVS